MLNRKPAGALASALLAGILGAPALAMPEPQIPVPVPGIGLEIRFAHTPPPRFRYERRPVRPYRDAVWIAGFWDWRDGAWVWIEGRWERPLRRHARWVPARYSRVRYGWRYEPGHWSHERLYESDRYHRDREWRRGRDDDRDRRRYDRDRERDGDPR